MHRCSRIWIDQSLWQSLVEAGKRLAYEGNISEDDEIVAGQKTLRALTEYRDDIAHWWDGHL